LQHKGFVGDNIDINFIEHSSNITIVGHEVGFLVQANALIDVEIYQQTSTLVLAKSDALSNSLLGPTTA